VSDGIGALRATAAGRVRLLRLLPRGGRAAVTALCAGQLVASIVPAVNAVVIGWLIQDVVHAVRAGGGPPAAPVAAVVALLVVAQLAELGHQTAGIAVARRIDGWVRCRVREIALAPTGIAHLEEGQFHDDVARASDLGGHRGGRRSPGTAVTGQVHLVFRLLAAFLAAGILAGFSPALAVALLVTSLLTRAVLRRQWMDLAAVMDAGEGDRRRAGYWAELAAAPVAAKEVRLFGLGDWFTRRQQQAALTWLDPLWKARRGILRRQAPVIAVSFGTALAALALPGVAAAGGELEPGALVTYIVAAWGVFAISFMGYEAYDIEYGTGAVTALDRLTARSAVPASPSPPMSPPVDVVTASSVLLDNVCFSYPATHHPVLDRLTLEIHAGEVLAVVGHNGAGKTTLVKLLAGLYQPTSGRIVVDDTDIADLDVERWRRRMTVVLQDFVHYPASAADNVALSAPDQLADLDGVRWAIDRAGAGGIIAGLPAGLHTPLWRGGTGGLDVSGGQWQKLALARALFAVRHGRRLLVLDEPTAHLDVRAEAEFHERVLATVRGTTVLLISHRLSTVRRADRIVVLDEGRVAECGSHNQLMTLGGVYCQLFQLQAARFAARDSVT
jgi:ATP-binding cassette, subfamily B, bacterial